MARLSHSSATAQGSPSPDVAFAELSQLLSRLRQNVLHPSPERERRLRISEYERTRVEANLEYARSVLARLELDATGIKAPARRLEMQGALSAQRETLETLLDRLEDLRHMAVDNEVDSSDGEDLLGEIVPTPSESMDSTSADTREEEPVQETAPDPRPVEPIAIPSPPAPAPHPPQDVSPIYPTTIEPPVQDPTQTAQSLRARSSMPAPPSSPASAVASAVASAPSSGAAAASHASARAALFAGRRRPATPQTSTATAEAILDQQRAEQDALSDSVLKMAGALKASSQRFSTMLEADREVLGRAGEGMEKTERGMEAARGRMGALRCMTDGKGWWGRMILYAWVYGLMVALVLLVFALPKLRF